jgi:protein phosphatase
MKLNLIAYSFLGYVRKKNEDGFLIHGFEGDTLISSDSYSEEKIYHTTNTASDQLFLALIDGMGGMGDGDVARDVILQSFQTSLTTNSSNEFLRNYQNLFQVANKFLLNVKKTNNYRDMGAVCTTALLKQKELFVSHLGDTRLYQIRNGKLQCLTNDHTYINQMMLSKKISKEEAANHPWRNMVMKSLGFEQNVIPDFLTISTEPKDIYMLFSDGVFGELDDDIIESEFSNQSSLMDKTMLLLNKQKKTNCNDNYTAIICEIVEN